jgi:hypothetical protein
MFEPCQKQDKCDSLLSGKCPFSARYPDPTTAPSSAPGDVAEQAKRANRFLRQIDPGQQHAGSRRRSWRVATAKPPSRTQAAVLEIPEKEVVHNLLNVFGPEWRAAMVSPIEFVHCHGFVILLQCVIEHYTLTEGHEAVFVSVDD